MLKAPGLETLKKGPALWEEGVVDVRGSWAGSQHVGLRGRARVEGLVQVALSGDTNPWVVFVNKPEPLRPVLTQGSNSRLQAPTRRVT